MTSAAGRLERRQRLVRRSVLVAPWLLAAGLAAALGAEARPGALEWALLAAMLVSDGIGIQVGFHRLFAHRSYAAHPAVRAALLGLGSMAGHGPVFGWVAVHRRHHERADREGDLHTPHGRGFLAGLWRAQAGWLWDGDLTLADHRSVADLASDPLLLRLGRARAYFGWAALGILLPALAGLAAGGGWTGAARAALWAGPIRILLSLNLAGAINSISHSVGRRRYRTDDRSRDNFLLAVPAFGAWQNTHHAFPSAYTTQLAWWQLDAGGWIIRLLEKAGLAWDLRMPTREQIAALSEAPRR